jgi:hypothetical protein
MAPECSVVCYQITKSSGLLSGLSAAIAAGIVPAIILLVSGPFAVDHERSVRDETGHQDRQRPVGIRLAIIRRLSGTIEDRPAPAPAIHAHAGRRHALALFVCTFFVLVLTSYLFALLTGSEDREQAGALAVAGSVLLDLGGAMLFNALAWLLYDYERAQEPLLVTAANRIALAVMVIAVVNTSFTVSDALAYNPRETDYPWEVAAALGGVGLAAVLVAYKIGRRRSAPTNFRPALRLVGVSLVTALVSVAGFDFISYVDVDVLRGGLPGWLLATLVGLSLFSHAVVALFAFELPPVERASGRHPNHQH